MAASSVAPMAVAPMAATDIRVSMENGVPWRAAATARRAIGTRPTAMAARKAQRSAAGAAWPTAKASTRAAPQANASSAFGARHQTGSGRWASDTASAGSSAP